MNGNSYFEQLLRDFVREKGFSWPEKAGVEPPRDKSFGDLATNLALVLAKEAKTNPRALAGELCAHIAEHGPEIEKAEPAGPGFVNITFKPDFWRRVIPEVLKREHEFGALDHGRGRKVQVEFVSANPTGPLHIGHGRGAAVGDSLARILRFTGHDVRTEYYLNDAGRQMNLLGLSVWVRLKQILGRDIELPEDCYKGDYIREIAAELLKARPELSGFADSREEEALAICREAAVEDILAGIKKDLEDFGVEHQVWFSEKSLVSAGEVDKTLDRLKDEGLAYEKDGALWFNTTRFGDDKDRVLRKSDGSLTYFASDIAYHADKYSRGFDLVVDVWGADHHGYVDRMTAAVQALGKEKENFKVILVQLVNLLQDGEQIAMSTRAGKFETLADVCKEVGADASRFIFLSRKSDSHLDFDLGLLKEKSMENPVYYVQYAHARICSVMRKAGEMSMVLPGAGDATPELLSRLDTPEDLDLLKHLARFPEYLAAASDNLSPHHVSYFIMELAGLLHRYYTVNQVLNAPDEDTVRARLLLMLAVAQTLRNGLGLIGVSAPERM